MSVAMSQTKDSDKSAIQTFRYLQGRVVGLGSYKTLKKTKKQNYPYHQPFFKVKFTTQLRPTTFTNPFQVPFISSVSSVNQTIMIHKSNLYYRIFNFSIVIANETVPFAGAVGFNVMTGQI